MRSRRMPVLELFLSAHFFELLRIFIYGHETNSNSTLVNLGRIQNLERTPSPILALSLGTIHLRLGFGGGESIFQICDILPTCLTLLGERFQDLKHFFLPRRILIGMLN